MSDEKEKDLNKQVVRLKTRLSKKNREIKELKITNLFFESLFDGISEEIMVIDQDFIINNVNRAFLDKYDLKKKDVLGKKCYNIQARSWAPCNLENSECPVGRAGKSGEAVEMTH